MPATIHSYIRCSVSIHARIRCSVNIHAYIYIYIKNKYKLKLNKYSTPTVWGEVTTSHPHPFGDNCLKEGAKPHVMSCHVLS